MPLALDLSQPAAVPERIASLPAEWADVDVLVNNAGVTADGLFARMSLEQWERVHHHQPDRRLRRLPRADPRHDAPPLRAASSTSRPWSA